MPLKINDDEGLMSSIPSYYEVKKKNREIAELQQIQELQEIFERTLIFYRENYPKSNRKVPMKWDSPKQTFTFGEKEKKINFIDFLENLSVEKKHLIREILFYSMKEHNYKKLETHQKMQELRGRVMKMIPGARYLKQIEKIENQKREVEEKLKELYKKYNEEISKAREKKPESKKEAPTDPSVICSICGKDCSSPAGLASHQRTQHPEIKKEE